MRAQNSLLLVGLVAWSCAPKSSASSEYEALFNEYRSTTGPQDPVKKQELYERLYVNTDVEFLKTKIGGANNTIDQQVAMEVMCTHMSPPEFTKYIAPKVKELAQYTADQATKIVVMNPSNEQPNYFRTVLLTDTRSAVIANAMSIGQGIDDATKIMIMPELKERLDSESPSLTKAQRDRLREIAQQTGFIK